MANEKTPDVAEKSSKRVAFQVMEAYKMIRTNLMFSLATKESSAVVFSSAEPSAGKSTLSANLAIVMAQTGARVLLIDAVQHGVRRVRGVQDIRVSPEEKQEHINCRE